jgi:bacillithiol biosynthesis deacetylase BshB1
MAPTDHDLDVLAVFAHPDDAELLCGGALLKSADEGERTGILDLTRGETGTRGTPELRAREAAAAADVLGLAVRRNAGLPDARIANSHEARGVVAGLIRELRPRVVVTHWPAGRHPDHRVASELVRDACYLAGLTNFDAPGTRFRPLKVVYASGFREDADPPSFVVDITGQMDRKVQAILAYESQFDGAVQAGEVFPGGRRGLVDQIRSWSAAYGSRIRVAYGEPYRTVETMEAATLGGLGVPTF